MAVHVVHLGIGISRYRKVALKIASRLNSVENKGTIGTG